MMLPASKSAAWLAVWCLLASVPAIMADETDTTPPELTGSSVWYELRQDGALTAEWRVYFTEPFDLNSTPGTEAFQFQLDGADWNLSAVALRNVNDSISDYGVLVLTVSPTPTREQRKGVWRLVYTPPSEKPLQGLAGNAVEAFDRSWNEQDPPATPEPEPDPPKPVPPGGGGAPPPPEPEPEPEPPPPSPPVPPEAAFTVDVACADGLCRALTGEDVTFTDTSSGTVSRRSWDFYVAAGRAPSAATARYAWSSPGFYEVTLTVSGADHESTASRVFLVEAANPAGTCQADGETICLQDSRYQVRATWRSPEGEVLPARVAHAGTNDSGLLWFHDAENWEVLVKVLDGCALNGADWVFAASATDLGFDLEITDTVSGAVRRYAMSAGSPAPALTDAAAFPERCRTQV
ncbi:MAG: PKD domain-containing protein, partial [Holophagales bacterium]|nr:PKD domain-containing protein [Holophagales bacterium]